MDLRRSKRSRATRLVRQFSAETFRNRCWFRGCREQAHDGCVWHSDGSCDALGTGPWPAVV